MRHKLLQSLIAETSALIRREEGPMADTVIADLNDAINRSGKQSQQIRNAYQWIADYKRTIRQSKEIATTCSHCGQEIGYVSMAVGNQTYCDDCFYTLYPFMDHSLPTDKNYSRRLL